MCIQGHTDAKLRYGGCRREALALHIDASEQEACENASAEMKEIKSIQDTNLNDKYEIQNTTTKCEIMVWYGMVWLQRREALALHIDAREQQEDMCKYRC